jgi:hypothetical protein
MPEPTVDHFRGVPAACREEESAVGLDAVRRRGEAECRELGGDDAALGGATGMERVRNRTEVPAQPTGLRRAEL